MATPTYRIDTQLIHAGEPTERIAGAVSMPIFQSSTFAYGGEGSYHDLRYIRLNNTPNHLVLHRKLAALEGAEAGLVTSSGMAAVSTTLLAFLSSGDHLLAQKGLYGGTHDFIAKDLPSLGIEFTFVDLDDPAQWSRHVRPNTRAFYVETITNPLLQVGDLEAVLTFSKNHRLISMIDNTFASPLNFSAIGLGFDLSLHSATKYLNGHTDIVAGAVLGRATHVETVKRKLDHLGGSLDPHACYLLHRGIKTLALRVRRQNQSALSIARFLENHPSIRKVYYPGLESHPNHTRARALLSGFGGVLSFETRGGVAAADRLMANLKIPVSAPSLGGVETLITRPSTTSHAGLSADERQQLGISDSLIRLSVGIEATEDLIEDFKQALSK
jgi:cystathionine beta-lyase/cystathionine gamma-synthase